MKIEVYLEGQWRHCADLTGEPGNRQRQVRLTYDADYAAEHIFARDLRAVSVRLPVDFGERTCAPWPAFLIDLLPQGAARRRLERAAGTELSEWALLQRGALNPVGNLRVIPEVEPPRLPHRPFALEEMIRRGDEFLEYATGVGAAVTGATDTQGEAPKFWIVRDEKGQWYPDDGNCDYFARAYFLLKFPVPEAGVNGLRILRHEAVFQAVARQLGVRTTADLPRYSDGALVVPRFDRRVRGGRIERLGVESLYALAGITDSAQPLRHDQVVLELAQVLTDFDTELREYLWRDLFNLAVGNRDNHGRNTAILKDTDGTLSLAPLFDVGPAFLDARAITRVMRWDGEAPGALNWERVLEHLDVRAREAGIDIDVARAAQHLGDFGDRLHMLPALMSEQGADDAVIQQRRADIERLIESLAQLPRSEMRHAPRSP
jgi:serine/threonine-protein kinase HipA